MKVKIHWGSVLGSVISMEVIAEVLKENVHPWGDCVEDAERRHKTGEKKKYK